MTTMYSACALPVGYERSWDKVKPRAEKHLAHALRGCLNVTFGGPDFVPEYIDRDTGERIEAHYLYLATGVKP